MSDAIESVISAFKTQMLMARPFYGDILLRLPIIRDDSAVTACTDGRTIRWSEPFFKPLTPSQIRYVLMHEVFHTLLRHPLRMKDRNPQIWNVAADIMVNNMCDQLARDLSTHPELKLERPPDGIFRDINPIRDTAETIYEQLKSINDGQPHNRRTLLILKNFRYYPPPGKTPQTDEVLLPAMDLLDSGNGGLVLTPEEEQALEAEIDALIRTAAKESRGTGLSGYIPRELLRLTRDKPLDWRKLLKDFLSEAQSDETSYTTPERKYLHMELILPGHGLKEEGELESVWAFVDSSGSIGHDDLNRFLTQLYRIVKDFRCEMNIAYWDTRVTDVYEKLRSEKAVLTAQPKHSGGTDINCVYRYIRERRLKPLVALILTDGYFGRPLPDLKTALSPRKTILLLSNESENPVYKTIGRVCRLTDTTRRTR